MRIYRRYVFVLILISCLVNTLLAFFGQDDLVTYLIINIICFLVLTLIFMPSNPGARKTFSTLILIFFKGFLVIVIIEISDIFSGQ